MAADFGALSRVERGSRVVEAAMGTLAAVLSGRVSSQFFVVKAREQLLRLDRGKGDFLKIPLDRGKRETVHLNPKPVVHLFPQVHLFPKT